MFGKKSKIKTSNKFIKSFKVSDAYFTVELYTPHLAGKCVNRLLKEGIDCDIHSDTTFDVCINWKYLTGAMIPQEDIQKNIQRSLDIINEVHVEHNENMEQRRKMRAIIQDSLRSWKQEDNK
jgi:hypothetical protein